MYFIGVTTHQSSIMKVFPRWAEYLGLGDVVIQGMNFRWHDEPENYRRAVEFIKHDPLSLGALVTTHKLDLLRACRDQFDAARPVRRADGRDQQHLQSRTAPGRACQGPDHQRPGPGGFLPARHWERTGAEALVLGAGGSAIAVTWYMLQKPHGRNRPVAADRHQSQHAPAGRDPPLPRNGSERTSRRVSPHAARRR